MNLAQLRTFVCVVDEGSFTRAAAMLGVTQSGASHAVASLERELGLPLIHRGRAGGGLTAHGERMLPHAREALRRIDRIVEDAATVTGRHFGRLRLACVPHVCQLLAPLIAEFRRRYPDVEVVLLEGTDEEVTKWVDEEIADLAVSSTAEFERGIPLAEDRLVAVVNREHALAQATSVSLADLADEPFILSDGGCESLIRRLYCTAGLPLRSKLRVRDMSTLLALVREQVGVTIIPELSFADPQGLTAIPVTPATRRCLSLVTRHTTPIGPAKAFFELIEMYRGQQCPDEVPT